MRHISRAEMNRVFEQVLGANVPSNIAQPNVWVASAAQEFQLGARFVLNNGGMTRVFHYGHIHALAGEGPGVTIVGRGRVMMSSDDGSERGAFLGAMTAGQYTCTWTTVEAVEADQFKHGFILLQGGRVLEIKSNTAGAALAVITLTFYDPLPETFAALARYALIQENPYANVYARESTLVNPEREGCVMGVINGDHTQDFYTWMQTWGPCGVISQTVDLGDEDPATGEHSLVHGIWPGDTVGIATGHGYQVIGRNLIANAVNWDNENFMIVDLTIKW